MKNASRFSIHPARHEGVPANYTGGGKILANLGLDENATVISTSPQYLETINAVLLDLCIDAQLIDYRRQVLDDFLSSKGVVEFLDFAAALRPPKTRQVHCCTD